VRRSGNRGRRWRRLTGADNRAARRRTSGVVFPSYRRAAERQKGRSGGRGCVRRGNTTAGGQRATRAAGEGGSCERRAGRGRGWWWGGGWLILLRLSERGGRDAGAASATRRRGAPSGSGQAVDARAMGWLGANAAHTRKAAEKRQAASRSGGLSGAAASQRRRVRCVAAPRQAGSAREWAARLQMAALPWRDRGGGDNGWPGAAVAALRGIALAGGEPEQWRRTGKRLGRKGCDGLTGGVVRRCG
jgi:hypothetical protein